VKKILIVDDQPIIRDLLKDFFKGKEYYVVDAVDGWDALRKVSSNSFDIIVTDIRMPGMNGMDFISELRRLRVKSKIIGMSGNSSNCSPDIFTHNAHKLESDAFITKPFDLQELHTLVKQLLY